MRGWIFAAALALAVSSGSAQAAAGDPREAALAKVLADARFEGVAAVSERDATAFALPRGSADRAAGRAHRVDEIWPWASVTKQITAALVMQEIERGRLTLETPLAQALPDYPGPARAGVTIKALLQHTSGLANPDRSPIDAASGAPSFYMRSLAPRRQSVDALGYCAGPSEAAPGARFDYNNCDYLVLGAILERLEKRPFAQIVRERISAPLGLKTVRVAPRRRTAARDVTGYDGAALAPAFNEATFGAGGALFGSAEDLLAFDRALMTGRVLSPAARATMWAGEPKLGYAALGAWSFPAPLKGCDGAVDLVERRGAIGGVQVRNVMAPGLGRALVMFTNDAAFEFGEIWQGQGVSFEAISAAFCGG